MNERMTRNNQGRAAPAPSWFLIYSCKFFSNLKSMMGIVLLLGMILIFSFF